MRGRQSLNPVFQPNLAVQSQAGPRKSTVRMLAARAIAIVVAGSGTRNLISLLGGPVPSGTPDWVRGLFPLDFENLSRTLTLLLGFALILSSIHLWAGRQRALQLALALTLASTMVHLTVRWNPEEAVASLLLAGLLWFFRFQFPLGSGRPRVVQAVRRAVCALGVAIAYGVAGFRLLEPRDFGQNFHSGEAVAATLRFLAFRGDGSLIPRTVYAGWFLDSLYILSAIVVVYSGVLLFRPVLYQFSPNQEAQARARELTVRYGETGQDYFKQASDKSFFFSSSGRSFLGYRVARSFALVLGDPVGPTEESAAVLAEFVAYCQKQGWRVGFHQVRAERLPHYETLGFRRVKIGDDALVDLESFSLEGSAMKEFRNTVSRLERLNYRVAKFDPPVDDTLVDEIQRVSDLWLQIPGHRERQFTLGHFDRKYVRSLPIYVVFDEQNQITAFLNLIPSYRPGLATVDLMRRRPDSPNGIIDFLFVKVFLSLKAEGYAQFSLGMAPVAEFREGETVTWEEKAVRWTMLRFPEVFRARSLRRFKAKYAHTWEPRYDVYQSRWDLPRLALALRSVAEIPGGEAA